MRYLTLAIVFSILAGTLAAGSGAADTKEAMQALQDYIGNWKGNGTSEKNKSEIWNEKINWSWRFQAKEAFFAADMPESKNFKSAEMRYLPAKEAYQLTVIDRADKKQVYEGALKKNVLVLERVDADSKETRQVKINTASDGDRLIFNFAVKPENRTLFNKTFQIAYTREGVTFAAAGAKKNECVVTGGLGTIAVSYKGVTYYVCCTGCRDAFNDNPEKILKEYRERKK